MARSEATSLFLGSLTFVAVAFVCVLIVGSRIAEKDLELDRETIRAAFEREEARHQTVEQAQMRLPQELRLAKDWSLEQALSAWSTDEIEEVAELAKQFSQFYGTPSKEEISADEKEELSRFVMHSSELRELLIAIEHGLCEITLDLDRGPWQVSNTQIHAMHSMFYMLSARALLLAEMGDKDGATKAVLSGYGLMDAIIDVPSMHIQSYRSNFQVYLGRALRGALSPDEIPHESRAVLSAYLERQSSKEHIVNALLLHEALARREVAEKYPKFMVSWHLAGYHEGIERIVQSLDMLQGDVQAEYSAIVDSAPFYALQTGWRLQNVVDALHVRVNAQRHVASVRAFLGLQ